MCLKAQVSVAQRRGVPNLVLKKVVGRGSVAGLEPDACGTFRNVLPRERSEPCFPAVGGTSESALMSSGLLRNTSNTPESSGVSHGTVTRESVTASFSAEVRVPSICPLKNTTNTHGSSGELHGTITDTFTAQRKSSSALPVSFVPFGVELVSRNKRTCCGRCEARALSISLVIKASGCTKTRGCA